MGSHNQVTIFSNGIADFRRAYALERGQPREITLDVKKPYVADVLASLNVYGDVALIAPPTFAPANENQGKLELDPTKAIEQLAGQLAGAAVRIERVGGLALAGTLLGLHTESEGTAGQPAQVKLLVVLTETGIAKLPIRDAVRVAFEDESVRQELAKALRRRAESLKPDSTQVRFSLEATADQAEAVVQYTVPAAAWKITYRFREVESGKFELQGLAIVDNNTDEDWNDFLVSVVTGEPISFSTDLAEAKIPRRGRVNVVQDSALGAVEVEDAEVMLLAAKMAPAGGAGAMEALEESGGKLRKLSRSASYMDAGASPPPAPMLRRSQLKPEAESREIGDYCVYECRRPVSIGANRSAIIPVFEVELPDARFVLYYKREQHPERPYRAIKLVNPGPQGLGRGVCTVFQGGIYGGHCVVPVTKPGEDRLLPFALETGVKVTHDSPRYEVRTAAVSIADGVCWKTTLTVRETTYRLRSSRDEPFAITLDHPHLSKRAKEVAKLEREGGSTPLAAAGTLPEGWRYEFPLAGKEALLVRIVESRTERTKIELGDSSDIPKLQALFDGVDGPLMSNPKFQHCLELQKQVAAKREEIARANDQLQSLNNRQERLRKNLGVAGNDEQSARWRAELGEAETRLTELEQTTLPRLQRERDTLEAQLRQALKALVLEWAQQGTAEEAAI